MLVREMMRLIESKTCVKFNEFPSSNAPSGSCTHEFDTLQSVLMTTGHHLEIRESSTGSCLGNTTFGPHPRYQLLKAN